MTSWLDKLRLTIKVEEMEEVEEEDVEVMAEELEDVSVMNDLLILKLQSSHASTSVGVTKLTWLGQRPHRTLPLHIPAMESV